MIQADPFNLPVIFLLDDEADNLERLRVALASQPLDLRLFRDGEEAWASVERGLLPDLVVSDVMMPNLDGFAMCRRLKADSRTRHVPVVLVTGLEDIRDRLQGFEAGADDFLTKPFYPLELKARVRSLLRIKSLTEALERSNRLLSDENFHLEERVRERTRELEDLTIGIVAALERANALRDSDTGRHIKRVCAYSSVLARHLGLGDDFARQIERFASLHDVGKVGIPDSILKKHGRLTPDEFEMMKRHTVFGYDLLGLAQASAMARNIALSHHERFDGRGYPNGLQGESIPIEARLVALADVYDALTTRRCYKEPFPPSDAERIIRDEAGSQFDPQVVGAMDIALPEFHSIRQRFADRDLPEPVHLA
jgi:putative two-component system response regulator